MFAQSSRPSRRINFYTSESVFIDANSNRVGVPQGEQCKCIYTIQKDAIDKTVCRQFDRRETQACTPVSTQVYNAHANWFTCS